MRLLIGVLVLLPLAAMADTAYVTDNLRLGLHAAEGEVHVRQRQLAGEAGAALLVAPAVAERARQRARALRADGERC